MIPDKRVVCRVIKDYEAPYPDPMAGRAGDTVVIDDSQKTDCPGWVWCQHPSGKSGWVPVSCLDRQGDTGTLRCDYDAVELTVQAGERLTCHWEESGFIRVTNQAGLSGWVPSSHVEMLHE